jgi:hypothetical protein
VSQDVSTLLGVDIKFSGLRSTRRLRSRPDGPITFSFFPADQRLIIFVHDGGSVSGLLGGKILVAGFRKEITDKGVPKPPRFPRLQTGSFLNFRAQVIQSADR